MLLPSIDHLIGDGLVSALPLGDPSAERPQPMVPPFTTLASGLVELELPSGFTTGPTSTSIEIAGRDTVEGWTATSKGNAIWHIADIDSARLSDLVSRGDGVVAFYDLGIDVGTRYMTLWQGRQSELYSFSWLSLEQGLAGLERLGIAEADGTIVISGPQPTITSEEIVATLISPTDASGDLVLELRPTALFAELVPSWRGSRGRHGDFFLLTESIDDGFRYVSTTAVADCLPVNGSSVLAHSQADFLSDFRVRWTGPHYLPSVTMPSRADSE